MKTLRLYGPNDLHFQDEPAPQAGKGEVRLQVKAVSICGSDLHWFQEGNIGDTGLEHPLILGHEFMAISPAGVRVAVEPSIACNQCEYCLRGDPNLCENLVFAGHGEHDGGLRQQMAWPEACLFPIPDDLSNAEATLLEPLGVAIHAVDLGKLGVGMKVGIFGAGPIGLLILQLARLSGASRIIVTDKLPHRLEAARLLGASSAILAGTQTEHQDVISATIGRGVDVAFEAAGENDAVDTAIACVRAGGRVILAGIPANDRTVFSASTARRKGLTIKLVRRMKHTYPRAIQLVQAGQVNLKLLVTHTFPFEEATQAFELAARREGLKVVILI